MSSSDLNDAEPDGDGRGYPALVDSHERVRLHGGVVFDIAKHASWTQLESNIEQGRRRHDLDVPARYATGRLLCRQGRAGSALFGAVLRSRPTWRRPVDSLGRLGGGWVERVSTDDLRPLRPELERQLLEAHRRQASLSMALR